VRTLRTYKQKLVYMPRLLAILVACSGAAFASFSVPSCTFDSTAPFASAFLCARTWWTEYEQDVETEWLKVRECLRAEETAGASSFAQFCEAWSETEIFAIVLSDKCSLPEKNVKNVLDLISGMHGVQNLCEMVGNIGATSWLTPG
jgi:hypothetical protein